MGYDTTPVYGFRTPQKPNKPTIPADLKTLATDVESALSAVAGNALTTTAVTNTIATETASFMRRNGAIPDAADVTTLDYGTWWATDKPSKKNITGLPEDTAADNLGVLEVLNFGSNLRMLRWTTGAATAYRTWTRFQYYTRWGDWQESTPTVDSVAGLTGQITPTQLSTALATDLEAIFEKVSLTRLQGNEQIDSLPEGKYSVPNTGVATALGLPDAWPGEIEKRKIVSSAYTLRFVSLRKPGVIYQRTAIGDSWTSWAEIKSTEGITVKALAESDSLDSLSAGHYTVPDRGVASALGLPDAYPGALTHYHVVGGAAVQVFQTVRPGSSPFTRTSIGGKWGDWVSSSATSSAFSGLERREILKQNLTSRKGGKIGTSGKAVFALRFDDAPADFREKALPILQRLNLPFTRVSTSDKIYTEAIADTEFTQMQDYCIQYGGEVWNHGADHNDTTVDAAEDNIVGALSRLRAKMPRIPIDCFSPPGGSITYGGQAPADSADRWATPVGNLILSHHAIASGYLVGSYYRPIDGVLRDSQAHYSVDTFSFSRGKALIDEVKSLGCGMVLMWHMNKGGNGGSYSSLADFTKILEYLAKLRDDGEILVLTKSGLGVADRSSSYREDILLNHSASSAFSESVKTVSKRLNVLGSTRELTATVKGTPGSPVTSAVGESSRSWIIPDSGVLPLRHVATIPLDVTSLVVSIDAPCEDVHLYAV